MHIKYIPPNVRFGHNILPSNKDTYLVEMVLFVCALDILCTAGLSGNRIIMEYGHHECCERL